MAVSSSLRDHSDIREQARAETMRRMRLARDKSDDGEYPDLESGVVTAISVTLEMAGLATPPKRRRSLADIPEEPLMGTTRRWP